MIKETILIVEDDLGLNELVSERINTCGYDTYKATSARQAFLWLKENTPLLMLLDYSLPDMNGQEFLTNLQLESIQVPPFIVATGQGDERVAVQLMKLGARDYIIKDTDFLEMIPLVVSKICLEIKKEIKLQQTLNELEESHQFNRQIIENAQEGIVVYDKNLKYIVWNPFMERLTGKTAQSVIGKTPLDLFPFLKNTSKLENILKAIEFKEINAIDIEFNILETGKSGWSVDKTAPFYNNNGEVIGAISTIHDITDRKRSEEALEESETKYRELVDNSPDAIAIYTDEKIVFVNNECLHLIGAKYIDELIGKNVFEFVDPEYRSFVYDRMERAKNEDISIPAAEEKFIRLDGTTCDVDVKAIPIRFNKEPSVQLIIRDISEKKRAEEALRASEDRYKTLIEYSNDLIWTLDVEGKFLFLNDVAILSTGFKLTDWIGKSFVPLILPEDLPMINDIFQRTINGEALTYELQFKKQDNSIMTLSVNTSPIYNSGIIEGVVSFGRDITEKKRSEEALNEYMTELIRFQKLTVDRELAMIELKKEINEIQIKFGQEPKYVIVK